MSHKKPTPVYNEREAKICPVCRTRSYSKDGIHPQCAVALSDEPRKLRLQAEKKLKADEKKAGPS